MKYILTFNKRKITKEEIDNFTRLWKTLKVKIEEKTEPLIKTAGAGE